MPNACWLPRALRSSPAAGVDFAGGSLLRFSVVLAFPPNRARTRSAISSSSSWVPSFSRSASRRASRSEIRCFSCSIDVVIYWFLLGPKSDALGSQDHELRDYAYGVGD